jgi:delta8-fatty-acid desaturase
MAPEARVWTRDEIATHILAGDHLVIYRDFLLRIPESWLQAHPGGTLAILHFVGRDATDEIEAYHFDQTLNGRMRGYIIGKVERCPGGVWEPLVPPVAKGWVRKTWVGKGGREGTWVREAETRTKADDDALLESEILLVRKGMKEKTAEAPTLEDLAPPPPILSPEVQQRHSDAYKELHRRVTNAGLYKTPFLTGYGPEFIRYFSALALSTIAYKYGWFNTSAIFLGLVWHQMTFFVHDLGHMGVTHSWVVDRVIGTLVADLFGGLSVGWWVSASVALQFYQYLAPSLG